MTQKANVIMNTLFLRNLLCASAAVAALSGCALSVPAPVPVQPIAFNFAIDNGAALGLVHAFEMHDSTVLQFATVGTPPLRIFNMVGDELVYKPLGQYLVINGLHPIVRVVSGGNQAVLRRKANLSASMPTQAAPVGAAQPVAMGASVPAAPANVPVTAAVPHSTGSAAALPAPSYPAIHALPSMPVAAAQPASLPDNAQSELYRQELVRIRKELAEVKGMLASQSQPRTRSGEDDLRTVERQQADARMLRVTFRFASADFEPSRETAALLDAGAPRARRIVIKAYTDSDRYTPADLAIAHSRAQSAKRYLVTRGIDESKIAVVTHPFGEFIADNKTAQGRMLNRRVEIELL